MNCPCNRDDNCPESVGESLVTHLKTVNVSFQDLKTLGKLLDNRTGALEKTMRKLESHECCPQATIIDVAVALHNAQRWASGSGESLDAQGFDRLPKDVKDWKLDTAAEFLRLYEVYPKNHGKEV